MNREKILKMAQDYMNSKKNDIVFPGEIGEIRGDKIEVIFLKSIALEPDVIVCPPDNRVWVNIKTNEVTWITQM